MWVSVGRNSYINHPIRKPSKRKFKNSLQTICEPTADQELFLEEMNEHFWKNIYLRKIWSVNRQFTEGEINHEAKIQPQNYIPLKSILKPYNWVCVTWPTAGANFLQTEQKMKLIEYIMTSSFCSFLKQIEDAKNTLITEKKTFNKTKWEYLIFSFSKCIDFWQCFIEHNFL